MKTKSDASAWIQKNFRHGTVTYPANTLRSLLSRNTGIQLDRKAFDRVMHTVGFDPEDPGEPHTHYRIDPESPVFSLPGEIVRHNIGLYQSSGILLEKAGQYGKIIKKINRNFKALEKSVGCTLETVETKGGFPKDARKSFPVYFFVSILGKIRHPFLFPRNIDGIRIFDSGNAKADQEHMDKVKKYLTAGIQKGFAMNYTGNQLLLRNREKDVIIYAVSPHPEHTDPEFLKELERWLTELIQLIDPVFLNMYSLKILPTEQSLARPGRTITILMKKKKIKKGLS